MTKNKQGKAVILKKCALPLGIIAAILVGLIGSTRPANAQPTDMVSVITYQGSALRNFDSEQQAQQWLDTKFPRIVLTANADGIINLIGPSNSGNVVEDCDDYAEWLVKEAAKDGYIIGYAPVLGHLVWGIYVTDVGGIHIGAMTRIGNVFYYIEASPSTNQGKLVRMLNAD